MSTSHAPNAGEIAACADSLAAAALRELPEALIVAFDSNMRVVVHAGQALTRLGGPASARQGQAVQDALPRELWNQLEQLFASALDGDTRSREIWTEEQGQRLTVDVGPLRLGARGEVAGGVAVILDTSARVQPASAAAAPGAGAFEEVFERAPIGTALLDREWRWLLVNHALCEITGYTSEELLGCPFDALIGSLDPDEDARRRAQLEAGAVAVLQSECPYVNAAGETLSAIVSMSLVRDESGEALHYIAQVQDISERKQLEERLRHLADHDPLTGLRNRRLFDHDLELQVARSQRYDEVAGLVLLDLDFFKQVNDGHGHRAGDETLKAVARALRARLRTTDLLARIGGDEFAALLPHIDSDGLAIVADGLDRVVRACAVEVEGGVLHPSASVGTALIAAHSASPEEVFASADRAMYERKREARQTLG